MRFVIDTNNALGMGGLALCAGLGWTLGCRLMSRILGALNI